MTHGVKNSECMGVELSYLWGNPAMGVDVAAHEADETLLPVVLFPLIRLA